MQTPTVDNTMAAWNWITANWGTTTWKKLPSWVAIALGVHGPYTLGVYGGMLITQKSAVYAAGVIAYLNRPRKIPS